MVRFYQRIIGNQGLSPVEKNILHPYIMPCMFISQSVFLLCARGVREEGGRVGAREGRAGRGGDGED